MSNFADVLTISLDDVSKLNMAAEAAIGLSHATSAEDCVAIEGAVLWAAESSQAFP